MQNTDSESETTYSALKENPLYLLSLINKYVKLELIKNVTIHGFVHSIDPIEYSIIILEHHNEKFLTTVVPGHAIMNVSEVDTGLNISPPRKVKSTSPTEDCIIEKKQKLISWLKQNLLPVTESEDNIIFGNLVILPPYNISDICTDNPIVAMQVMNLMKKMPENFQCT
ncbi:uncharacterized protein LOC123656886 [Melitaea cinxia]|uniref:uncharacterized protein LOC123656886 n=1 Tax=Melitaea cinxia TaxID=113334 RepID=UPI001E2722C8|nr:uncharacterized protein LOC123656886 [Melitaea cinxia]